MTSIYESAIRLTSPFESVSLLYALIGSLVLFILWLLFAVLLNNAEAKAVLNEQKPQLIAKLFLWAAVALTFVFMMFSVCFISIYANGKMHGMYDANRPISTITHHIANSPVEDKLPPKEKRDNILVLVYRFGCKDCIATYPELQTAFGSYPNVYWVSSRSKQGKELLNEHPVDEVPAGMYLYGNGGAVIKTLYKKDTKAGTRVSRDAVELMLKYLNDPPNEKGETD